MDTVHYGKLILFHLLWIVPVLAGLHAHAYWRRRHDLAVFARPPLDRFLTPQVSYTRQRVKSALVLLAVCFLVVAIVQPKWGERQRTIRGKGRDVVVALDVSKSMLADDVVPNRLASAKTALRLLTAELRKQPGHRMALVAFAGTSAIKVPLTLDYGYFDRALETLGPDAVSRGGTQLGTAVQTCLDAFDDKLRNYKDIILITDGEDHDSFPLDAAKEAKKRGVVIYTVGLGDKEHGRRIPVSAGKRQSRRSYLTHKDEIVWTKLHDTVLREMAAITGGAYVPAGMRDWRLDKIFQEKIAGKEARETQQRKQRRHVNRYQWFLGVALLLMLCECLVRERRET